MNKLKAIIVDIDNVLVDSRAMQPYLPKNKFCRKAWDEYHKHYNLCTLNKDMWEIIFDLSATFEVIFLTGREEVISETINTRLITEKQIPSSAYRNNTLLMRKYNDYRSDHVIKEEYVKELVKEYGIILAIDDLEANIDMFKRYNIPTALYNMNKGII